MRQKWRVIVKNLLFVSHLQSLIRNHPIIPRFRLFDKKTMQSIPNSIHVLPILESGVRNWHESPACTLIPCNKTRSLGGTQFRPCLGVKSLWDFHLSARS